METEHGNGFLGNTAGIIATAQRQRWRVLIESRCVPVYEELYEISTAPRVQKHSEEKQDLEKDQDARAGQV